MTNRRLLTCPCGRTNPVELRQAGGEITCACGATMPVPPLRLLRELPEQAAESVNSVRNWGVGQGVLSLFLALGALLAAAAGYYRVTEPNPPAPFDFQSWKTESAEGIAKMPVGDLWRRWLDIYSPQQGQGFQVYRSPEARYATAEIARHRTLASRLLLAAGITAGVGGVLFALLRGK